MGFGLPSALGAATAYDGTDKGRPQKVLTLLDSLDSAFKPSLASAANLGLMSLPGKSKTGNA